MRHKTENIEKENCIWPETFSSFVFAFTFTPYECEKFWMFDVSKCRLGHILSPVSVRPPQSLENAQGG